MAGMLQDKVAIVTGAGAGIGRASALAFAREGAAVMVADLDEAAARETARMIANAGGSAEATFCDVTNKDIVHSLVEACVRRFGALHCAHNNAGIEGRYARTLDTDEANFDATYGVNLKGVFLCMQAQIAHMLDHGGGAIVNTASIAGLEGARQLPAYVASKHAVMGLTRTTALEYAGRGIRVNAVCPGPIRTRMLEAIMDNNPKMQQATVGAVPMRRLGEPQEIAEAAVWLASDRASFVTGHGLVADGGMTAGS